MVKHILKVQVSDTTKMIVVILPVTKWLQQTRTGIN